MKISELFEKLTAGVHINDDKKLYVISNLVQREFGPYFDKISGGCLAAQMIYSMASAANVDPFVLMDALNRSNLTAGYKGTTLEDLYKVFNKKPIKVKKKKIIFELSVETPSLDDAIQEVKSGQPIIFIPSRKIQDTLDDLQQYEPDGSQGSGIAKISDEDIKANLSDQSSFHSFLLIGYDVDGYLIVRDMRHRYSYKGYGKLPVKQLKKNPNAYKFITIVVDNVKDA